MRIRYTTKTLFTAAALLSAAALDFAAKWWALRGGRFGYGTVRFELFENPGIAFSLPVPLSIVTPLTAVLLLGISYGLITIKDTRSRLFLTSAFLGATSNLIDRLLHNFTTDYIIIHRLAINIADILIVIGIVGFAWYTQKVQAKQRP